jgi:cytochrome P450
MKRGDRIFVPLPAGGRDPREFENAAGVNFDRECNRHMAFGAGPHRCLGSYLARAELAIALEEWHRRIPEYSLADDEGYNALDGEREVPAGLEAMARRGADNCPERCITVID